MLLDRIIVFFLFFIRFKVRSLVAIRRVEGNGKVRVTDGYVSFLIVFLKKILREDLSNILEIIRLNACKLTKSPLEGTFSPFASFLPFSLNHSTE